MNDTDPFCAQEILALTAIGESESLGAQGMTETICTIVNRAKANMKWMGGNDVRAICLVKDQYDAWWPETGNDDRQRILNIGLSNPTYQPYQIALGIAGRAISGTLPDSTNNAVSYFDSGSCAQPDWAEGKQPCYTNGKRFFYDLAAIMRTSLD